jgi:ArsR family transcriptional regulator, arsenate/arsenite/antimonite-responsive transcriptional repressor
METAVDEKKDLTAEAEDNGVEALVSLASALFDIDRLRIAAALSNGPANRMELAEKVGLSHRELIRQLDLLQYFRLARPENPSAGQPDHYTRYVLNEDGFRQARQAMAKYRGQKPRPTDKRELTIETFMPGGKLTAFPLKNEQIVIILDEVVEKFELQKQYTEKQVNVILEEINEDYCSLRRLLIDYRYLSRNKGIYVRNEASERRVRLIEA